MGVQGFERRLERLVEGAFGKAFRSGLQPVEIARKLLREMDNGRTIGVRGTVVPNYFLVCLCEEDADALRRLRRRPRAGAGARRPASTPATSATTSSARCRSSWSRTPGCARATSRSRPRSRRAPAAGSGRSCCPTAGASPWAPSAFVIGRLADCDLADRGPARLPAPRRDPARARRLPPRRPRLAERHDGQRRPGEEPRAGRRRRDRHRRRVHPVRGVVAASTVSEGLLTVLKFCFLALLYLFLFRVVRIVRLELKPAKVAVPVDAGRRRADGRAGRQADEGEEGAAAARRCSAARAAARDGRGVRARPRR